ncbi:MAG: hypothetical protein CVV41_13500 [Candidatus Riflebacteria bacterium HGW-Riflebacteria-1]|nr:MAG: hypothetical protein CVV41_13500 [Candidatus Riflebacteria bacterium HGW-Riflebacteria-1]
MSLNYEKLTYLNLKNCQTIYEVWIQDRIVEDLTILGLVDLILKDRERIQPTACRLDLLLPAHQEFGASNGK